MSMSRADEEYREFEHASWERVAAGYVSSFEMVTAIFARALLGEVRCQANDRLLDIACGAGYLCSVADAMGAKVVGTDFSASMIAEGARRFPSVRFVEGDAEDLPFGESSFDKVVIGFGAHHFPSPQRAIAEVRRVLRPGGEAGLSVWSTGDHVLQQLLIDAIQECGAPTALPAPPRGALNTTEQCRELLLSGGFSPAHVRVHKVRLLVPVRDAAQLLQILDEGTSCASQMIRSQPAAALAPIGAAIDRALRSYASASGTGFEVPAVAVMAAATKQ